MDYKGTFNTNCLGRELLSDETLSQLREFLMEIGLGAANSVTPCSFLQTNGWVRVGSLIFCTDSRSLIWGSH